MDSYWVRNNSFNSSFTHFRGTLGSRQYLFLEAIVPLRLYPKLIPSLFHMECPPFLLQFTVSHFPSSIQFSTPISNAGASVKCSLILQPEAFLPPLMFVVMFYIFLKASVTCNHLLSIFTSFFPIEP